MDNKQENSSSSCETKQNNHVENVTYHQDSSLEEDGVKLRSKDEGTRSRSSSPKMENTSVFVKEEDELESVKNEMGEMKEENERLKKTLERIENDYRSLQMRFFDIIKREDEPPSTMSVDASPTNEAKKEEPETSLSLGLQFTTTNNNNNKRKKDDRNSSSSSKARESTEMMMQGEGQGLSLGLEYNSSSSQRINLIDVGSEKSNESQEEGKEGETRKAWSPSKVSKTMESSEKEDESLQSNTAKRARVSVRARCDTPTMNDGCQWRKYGQKIAKGNPCPRAYYRCTVAPACPVRKQVQRCSNDMSILITTYEGTHNHQLPVAATAMASTTSAAASILMAGSSTSQGPSSCSPIPTTANLNGVNFTLYNSSKPGRFNLPNSSSPTPPTITLDLTANSSSQFTRRFSSNFLPSHKYSRSLDFSSSETTTAFPAAWSSTTSYQNYDSMASHKNHISFGKTSQEQISHPYMDRISQTAASSSTSSQQFLTQTLTRVLSSDPTFQSAVAAAISSMVGSGNSTTNNNNNPMNISRSNSDSLTQTMKFLISEQVPGISSLNTLSQNSKMYLPNFLNRPTSSTSNSQGTGSYMVLQPQFPFPLSRTSSTPDIKDHLK